ncbi:hypothetical protein GPL15_19190 [Clostridium sp. MCC353]|uniref:hypothetical protein n=1 Tax=Clostridium sp. MCC353 TaxID=2592646 RepID=UPI001C0292E2|nr:hypothetical protein [Clostridium sp. MCC353]MBT9778622.1 hypothetical protein [Clostridium sp. MCC353]
MTSLTFLEFLDAFHMRDLYENIDLFDASGYEDYDKLKKYFDIYLHIGGYPEVVKTYIGTGSIEACADLSENHVAIFVKESTRYFDSPLETATFDKVFSSIAAMMLKKRRGLRI